MSNEVKYLTTKQVADRIGYSPGTLKVWRSQFYQTGDLKGPNFVVTTSNKIRYELSAILKWESKFFK